MSGPSDHQHLVARIVDIILVFARPRRIVLFGSRSRGEGRKYSDFDVAVEGACLDLRTRRRIVEELDRQMGIYTVDLVELETVDEPLANVIRDQGEVVYERSP